MRKVATFCFVSTAVLACLALASLTSNCGGNSDGERPGGTGGAIGSGGSGGGSGGSITEGLNCAAAVIPNNVVNGGVTDFTDWSNTNGKWGTITATGLFGSVYKYAGPNSSMTVGKVEGTPSGLHLVGSVASNDYGGGGLGFSVCATVASFTKLEFSIMGSSPGCDLELQIQTFDQRPTDQTPPGGCDMVGGASCFGFPVVTKVVDLSTAITTPLTVTKPLADFSGWSEANAKQVVGLQWQFTGTNIDPDAGVAGCPIDVTITSAKFLP